MRFGIFDHMERFDQPLHEQYEQRLQMLEQADAAGFWCYHKAEHHFTPLDAAPSANVFLAAAAQRTRNLRLGTLVYLLPFYDPIRLVEEICMLDHLSGGRLEVGVGKGISPAEHTLWGNNPEQARERFEATFTHVRAGLHNQLDGAKLPVQPLQLPHPPLWYPGNLDYAARHRMSTITGGPISKLAEQAAFYRKTLAAAEHNWNPGTSEPTIGVTRHVYVADTDAAAIERARSAYRTYHDNLAHLWNIHDVPFPSGDPSLGGDSDLAMRVEALVAGSPETVRNHVAQVRDAGHMDYFVGAFAWGDLTHAEVNCSLGLFADEVMPAFAAPHTR